jgi:hypothetical protein
MTKLLPALLVVVLLLAGCSRSPKGSYQSSGSEDKFLLTLDLVDGGHARFATRANLGNPAVDRGIEATMTINAGRWSEEGGKVVVTGAGGDGKPVTYRFAIQKNGDLIWENNGARLVKKR